MDERIDRQDAERRPRVQRLQPQPSIPPRQRPGEARTTGRATSRGGRRRPARWLRAVVLCVAAVVVMGAAGAGYVMHRVASGVQRADVMPAEAGRPIDDKARTVLVIGTDSRDGLTAAQRRELSTGRAECNCTDTLMLVRLEEGSAGATVVNLPRDLMVEMPGWTDPDGDRHPAAVRQVNAALAAGGAELVVRTVESVTGVRVDHVVQVDFASVVDVVDAMGGVDVCVREPIDDRYTRLSLGAGHHRLGGVDALKYVRLRAVGDGSDLSRIERQQQFVINALAEVSASDLVFDPLRLSRVTDAALGAFVVDEESSTSELVSLAARLRAVDRSDLVLITVPNEPYAPDPNRVALAQPAADRLFDALRAGEPVGAKSAKKSSASTRPRTGASNPCAV